MDFASVMKAELEAQKQKVEKNKSTGKSWMKKSELKANEANERKRKKEAAQIAAAEELLHNKKAKVTEDGTAAPIAGENKGTHTPSISTGTLVTKTGLPLVAAENEVAAKVGGLGEEDKKRSGLNMAPKEVVRQLRDRNEPIRLFGETDTMRMHRLEYLKTHEAVVDEGMRNDFMEAIDRVNEKYLQSFLLEKQQSDEQKESERKRRAEERGMIEDVTKKQIDSLYKVLVAGKATPQDSATFCLRYVQYLLMKWEDDLENKDINDKRTAIGRKESAIYSQTCSYIEPMQAQLKKNSLGEDIMPLLTEVFKSIYEREYIYAADMYLRLAIGNAAWPIGVTQVGIHSRTGREKIFSQHVAHVLNDEEQRKYIQALKRLMTYAQKRFPADPSKCLEFNGLRND
ncbi:hypothetical protein SARC_01797 [Sphaeroforma arctica JP610]|uniref:Pre-mRNA-splicing factor 18 n=1 Tax=Sphaeroforma arctica JP610 TaxID=667725 RepID=A0A0L0GCS7_9EUKA|nr:hypothetical protein SARC_01797 [Sphaeroforma arctica JP610]KNC86038.1 hypothetical protein SARC_01797 [Sphaeroforma arctica JP610]|eukprot:XP_014159940.1 hypothetical protein SARC_01797 [Sphaeroforma arctica JP610]